MRQAIGIIDSGVGGLSILNHLSITLPFEDYIYLSMPFFKNVEEIDIKAKVSNVIEELLSRNVKIIIVACDLLATVMNEIDLKKDVPIIMISSSVIKYANEFYEHKNMLFLAREEVVEASLYQRYLRADQLYTVSANKLINLAQSGKVKTAQSFNEVMEILNPFLKKHIDVFITGSTNISLFKTEILEVFPDIDIIPLAEVIAIEVNKVLEENKIKNKKRRGKIYIISSEDKIATKKTVKSFNIKYSKIIQIEN